VTNRAFLLVAAAGVVATAAVADTLVLRSGRLSLGVNDDYLQDNSGSWRVTIYY
jgi:hypothetical protein